MGGESSFACLQGKARKHGCAVMTAQCGAIRFTQNGSDGPKPSDMWKQPKICIFNTTLQQDAASLHPAPQRLNTASSLHHVCPPIPSPTLPAARLKLKQVSSRAIERHGKMRIECTQRANEGGTLPIRLSAVGYYETSA